MAQARVEKISAAKSVNDEASIIGRHLTGAVFLRDKRLVALKHNIHRHNGNGAWGREDGGYTGNDLMDIGFQISPLPVPEMTARIAQESLEQIQDGETPKWATVGAEVEGAVYDRTGTRLVSVYDNCGVDVNSHPHPELLAFTLETATSPTANGEYARQPVDIARSLAAALLQGHSITDQGSRLIAYSSVPEAGNYTQAKITPHPYLLSFAPKVLRSTLEKAGSIPDEVIQLYQLAGIDVLSHLKNDQILNWPVHAYHVHTGVPIVDGLADSRAALAMGLLRLTEFSKVMSFMLSNTRHLYGVDTNHKDVRAILRRLLPTSHDATIPTNADSYFEEAIQALVSGQIHSLPRFPAQGQHDRLRLRVDADKNTIESIDASMNPDIRLLLSWTYFNQLLTIIALDALKQPEVSGDESMVIPYLKKTYGSLFSVIPTMGSGSSFEQDLSFDRSGYAGTISSMGGKNIAELLVQSAHILKRFAIKYPAIKIQTDIVDHMIHQQLIQPANINLAQYFGIESGKYHPNGFNTGIVTDYKSASLSDIITVESQGNRLQAEAVQQIRDEADLYSFFGIKNA